jgi:FtsP/CotA-like multicopper oxidase with cupredoxin domain
MNSSPNEKSPPNEVSRRSFIKTASTVAGASVFNIGSSSQANVPLPIPGSNFKGAIENTAVPRWQDELPFDNQITPLSTGSEPAQYGGVGVGKVFHGVAPEYFDHPAAWDRMPTQFFHMRATAAFSEMLPKSMGLKTPVWTYEGVNAAGVGISDPQFRFRIGQPALVRFENMLPEELSVHMHGGHWPSHSDGHASFLTLPGEKRDYYYPNVLPLIPGTNEPDISEAQSTLWFHDHAADMTAIHVNRGLTSTAKCFDDLELNLIREGILPGIRGVSDTGPAYENPYDMFLVIGDRVFTKEGAIWYDSNNHDGYIGNVELVNGKAYPRLKVEARKYRFRMKGGSSARHRRYRLSNNASFLRIANDAVLFPQPQRTQSILIAPGKRADIIIDFSKYRPGTKIYLENILEQKGGRGPEGKLEDSDGTTVSGTPPFIHQLMMFEVVAANPANPDASITDTTALRPHRKILESEVAARRSFRFERKNGHWAINGGFYEKTLANACPTLGSTEEWTLTNGSGGWWHPIHIHLENHQTVRNLRTGKTPLYHNSFNQDVQMLGPNDSVVIRMRFRTFKGPFVFHCHTNEHEDLEMMFQFDPRTVGSLTPQPVQQFFP